jgi:hypothetical protein
MKLKDVKESIKNYKVIVKCSENYIEDIDRKEMPVYSGVLKYFPNAIKYVAYVSKKGNEQHHPDKPLHWDMDKSTDEPDALLRHLIDHSINPIDEDGVLHLGKTVWRGLAMLERYLTNNNK